MSASRAEPSSLRRCSRSCTTVGAFEKISRDVDGPPSSRSVKVDPRAVAAARTAIDTILQSSAVELFHAEGVALAPMRPTAVGAQQRFYEWVGVVAFEAPNLSGTLCVSVPRAVWLARRAGAGAPKDGAALADWSRELANQLIGRVKNRLIKFQVVLRPRLPTALSGAALEQNRPRTATELLYRFRALRGDVLVVFDAPLERTILAYSGGSEVAREGELILF
jgi:hypothetical protein